MNDLNTKRLSENLKDTGHYGLLPAVDVAKDMIYKPEFHVNGWFVIGHYDIGGQLVDFMLHFLYLNPPGGFPGGVSGGVDVNVSITNETTGEYVAHDAFYPNDSITVETRDGKLYFETPTAKMSGDLDHFHAECTIPDGAICVDMEAYGGVLYNGGCGQFPNMFGGTFNQYSMPNWKTQGTVSLHGKRYEIVNGKSWLDRQFQCQTPEYLSTSWKWCWMDINLDNGEILSMWDMRNVDSGLHGAWATIMHPDGHQTVTWMEDWVDGVQAWWTSPVTERKYPVHWTLKIPEFDCEFEVISSPAEQEIAATTARRHKYEGASQVTGTYRGEAVKGFCYAEVVGDWFK